MAEVGGTAGKLITSGVQESFNGVPPMPMRDLAFAKHTYRICGARVVQVHLDPADPPNPRFRCRRLTDGGHLQAN